MGLAISAWNLRALVPPDRLAKILWHELQFEDILCPVLLPLLPFSGWPPVQIFTPNASISTYALENPEIPLNNKALQRVEVASGTVLKEGMRSLEETGVCSDRAEFQFPWDRHWLTKLQSGPRYFNDLRVFRDQAVRIVYRGQGMRHQGQVGSVTNWTFYVLSKGIEKI